MVFSLFKKKSFLRREDDRFWLTKEDKFRGIGDELSGLKAERAIRAVVAHFRRTLEELEEALGGFSMPYRLLERSVDPSGLIAEGKDSSETLLLLSERLLIPHEGEKRPAREEGIAIIGAERYPIREKDESIERFAETLPCRCRLRFHTSLDEPFVKLFVGENLAGLLETLGFREGESVSHPMIAKSLIKAQGKVAKRAVGDQRVDSAEEWLRYNCPEGR